MVLLALAYQDEYARRIAAGVARAATGLGWTFVPAPEMVSDPGPASRLSWRPDGIISLATRPAARALARLGAPHVDLGQGSPDRLAVGLDEAALARLAAAHLAERGYRSLALVHGGATPRSRAFLAAAGRLSLPVACLRTGWMDAAQDPHRRAARIGRWLGALPGPVGVFCHNDGYAHAVLAACRSSGLAVPAEVGVLGCDDEPLFTGLGHVALSSVVADHEESGYRAGERLARIIAGMGTGPARQVVSITVAARASTDLRLVQDPIVAEALTWIRMRTGEAFSVDSVSTALGIHRRTLERRMQAALGCSVLDAIHQAAVARARDALRSGMPVQAAARAVGLSPSTLRQLIRARTGVSPRELRDRHPPGRSM